MHLLLVAHDVNYNLHLFTHLNSLNHECIQVNDSGCNSLDLAVREPCGDIQRTDRRLGVGHTLKGRAEFTGSIVKGKISFVSIIIEILCNLCST